MREVKTYYIQDGNTVRYTTAEPLPDRQTREREKRQEALRQRRIRERKRAAAMRRHRLHTFYLTMAVVAVCALFVGYVQLQTDTTTRMEHVAQLEDEISSLKAENSAAQSRIDTATNLNAIKAAAVNELGMGYASSDQIVYYDMARTDYMSQYHEIP